jgi:heat shock factor-binding protein 1
MRRGLGRGGRATEGADRVGGGLGCAADGVHRVCVCLSVQQSRFQAMSDAIIGKIDEMSSRIDDLEKSVAELMEQATQAAEEGASSGGGGEGGGGGGGGGGSDASSK